MILPRFRPQYTKLLSKWRDSLTLFKVPQKINWNDVGNSSRFNLKWKILRGHSSKACWTSFPTCTIFLLHSILMVPEDWGQLVQCLGRAQKPQCQAPLWCCPACSVGNVAVIEGVHHHIIRLRAGSPFTATAHLYQPTKHACISNVCAVCSESLQGTVLIVGI